MADMAISGINKMDELKKDGSSYPAGTSIILFKNVVFVLPNFPALEGCYETDAAGMVELNFKKLTCDELREKARANKSIRWGMVDADRFASFAVISHLLMSKNVKVK
jgi:hypothetical protein